MNVSISQKNHLTSNRHQLFNSSPADLSVLLPFSCCLCARLRCWQLRNTTTAFSKSHKSTLNILSFFYPPNSSSTTPLHLPPAPLGLFLWMLTMAFSVGKWLRLKECESVCDFVCVCVCVCVPPYCHRLSGPERDRENLTKWQQDRISASHCDRVGVTKPGVTVEKEGGREKKTTAASAAATSPTASLKIK